LGERDRRKEAMMPSTAVLSRAGVKGGSAPNHKWTEEERATVRQDYKGTNASAQEIADRLGVTRFAVKGQAQKLGIMRQKSPPWTDKELERLKELIHRHSVAQIAKKLHRSPNAVKIKATRLELDLRLRFDWYTKRDVCEIVGEDHHKVQKWIDSGELKATWHNDRKPDRKGMAMWHIEAKDLKEFIVKHAGELLGRNVDIQQIVWLLTKIELG
jgi:DNA-binding CsgD family transcriptional regulator